MEEQLIQDSGSAMHYFAPVRLNLKDIVFTFLYASILAVFIYFLYLFLTNLVLQYDIGRINWLNFLRFYLLSYLLIPLVTFSSLLMVAVYKKNSIAVSFFIVVYLLFSGFILWRMVALGGFNIKFFVNLAFLMIGIFVFGILLRAVLKITSRILKSTLFLIPYLLVLIIFGFTILHAQTVAAPDCSRMTDSDKQALCYDFLARKTNNLDFCMQMHRSDSPGYYYDRDTRCIPTVVANLKLEGKFTSTQCPLFLDIKSRDYCYSQLSLNEQNKDLCGLISDLNLQKFCLNKYMTIQDIKVGTSTEVVSGSTVTVNYVGTLLDGKQIASSYGSKPFQFKIGKEQVIQGWDYGIIGMKVGGKRQLVVPPNLAYGDQIIGSIPSNSVLKFSIELLDTDICPNIPGSQGPLSSDLNLDSFGNCVPAIINH